MGYNKADLEKKALKILNDNPYIFIIQDVVAQLPITRTTFYNMGLDKLDTIKEALERNKIATKSNLKKRWANNSNPTTDIALYKLASTNEELEKLTSQKVSADVQGKIIIDFTTDD